MMAAPWRTSSSTGAASWRPRPRSRAAPRRSGPGGPRRCRCPARRPRGRRPTWPVRTCRVERDAVCGVVLRTGDDLDAGSDERLDVRVDDCGLVPDRDELGEVDAALDEAGRERCSRLLEGTDRVDAVGQRRVARDAAHREHVRVRRFERQRTSGAKPAVPALSSFERTSPCMPTASSSEALAGAPYAFSRTAGRSSTGRAEMASSTARAMWRSWSETHATGTPPRAATSDAIASAVNGVPRPAAWRCTSRRFTISAARESLPSRISAAVAVASGDFSRNGSMPFPHTYMRPGFAGSLTRMPAAASRAPA